jgi:hypothetical protein
LANRHNLFREVTITIGFLTDKIRILEGMKDKTEILTEIFRKEGIKDITKATTTGIIEIFRIKEELMIKTTPSGPIEIFRTNEGIMIKEITKISKDKGLIG